MSTVTPLHVLLTRQLEDGEHPLQGLVDGGADVSILCVEVPDWMAPYLVNMPRIDSD